MTDSPGDRSIAVDTSDGVATVTLQRPDRLNALTAEMAVSLGDTLRALATDDAARVVVLTGAGRGFCAGGDVGAMASAGRADAPAAPVQLDLRRIMEISELLVTMAKPTIAAINGPCAGAGLSFACACDLRYAARSAVFAAAFLRVGSSGDHGSAWMLTRAVGPAKARELLFVGDRLDAAEAHRIGLVHEVVDDAALRDRVATVASGLAGAAPLALRNLKANANDALSLPLADYLDRETARFAETMRSGESRDAARAFLEQRTPPS